MRELPVPTTPPTRTSPETAVPARADGVNRSPVAGIPAVPDLYRLTVDLWANRYEEHEPTDVRIPPPAKDLQRYAKQVAAISPSKGGFWSLQAVAE